MLFTYLARELRRRSKQAAVVALGLGIGVALVVTVSAASAGVKTAQATVLHSLYGVGTDMSVTQTAAAGSGGPQRFSLGGSGTAPAAGTPFARDVLSASAGSATFSSSKVAEIEKLKGVNAASGGLLLDDRNISGTFGSFGLGASSSSGSSSSTPPPISFNSFSVAGVQVATKSVGPLTASEVTSGRWFTADENSSAVAIVSSSYAKQQSLKLGSSVTVAATNLDVIGIASLPSGSTTDVFLPLGEAQKLSDLPGEVTTVYVSAKSASEVSAVVASIHKLMPNATVTTSADLASEVTGSLSSASSLATNLGKWLSIAALLVAFSVAALLMVAAVSRRVREFGTLKALGWRTRRVVGQVMSEGLVQGLLGGVVGVGLGIGGAALVSGVAPSLTATVGPSFATGGGFGGSGVRGTGASLGGLGGPSGEGVRRNVADLTHSVAVHLTAPVEGHTLLLAILLAIAGGIVAGSLGAWRAARLRPANALRKVE
jgi:ABC-type antimicrobial peptide transport system permease subunit